VPVRLALVAGIALIIALVPSVAAAAPTATVVPNADTYVDASAPKQRFGTGLELLVGSAPTRTAYIRFDLRTVTSPLSRATLVVRATSASLSGFDVRPVTDTTWNERSMSYQNAPAVGATVAASSGSVTAGPVSVDVTPIVSAGRIVVLALTSPSTAPLSLASRETSGTAPQLVLEAVDAGAPSVTLTSPAAGSSTNQPRPTFAGAAGTAAGDSATVTVKVYAGSTASGTPVQTLQATAAAGSWSVVADAALADGTYTAQAEQADDAGNVGRSSPSTFTVDTSPPAPTLTSPASGSTVAERPTFAGAAGIAPGDGSAITVRVYAGTAATGTPVQTLQAQATGGSWSATATAALADGTYTARAAQADAAGNTGLSTATTFGVVGTGQPPPAAYRSAVMSDSPRAYWRLGETSGLVAADQTSSGIAGSYMNGVALGRPGAVGGDPDTAIAVDGANDTVRVANAAGLNSTSAMSLEAWLKPLSLPATSATIARKEGQYLVRLYSNGSVRFRLWKGSGITEISTPAGAIGAASWSHVVVTWDGATMRIYVGGTVRASGSLAAPANVTAQDLYLGSSYNSYDYYTGGIDEVAVYGAALSATRVQAHYAAATSVDTTAPAPRLMAPTNGSTTDATPNFGGSGGTTPGDAPTVTVRVYSGTAASGTPAQSLPAAVQTAGTFSVRASPLASGTYTAVAEQADAAGNVGRSDPSTFTVNASGDPVILAAGDIAGCGTFGDEATAALLDRLPGTVLTLGDHVYEDATASDFANCYDPTWGRHKARTRPTIGDHEYRTPGAAPYFDYFGAVAGDRAKGYYSYDLGAWHVISLNEVCSQIGGCGAGSPEEQWLRADLAAHPAQCTLAILHKPRFSSGAIHGSDPSFQPFWQALYDHRAELVLSGDDHVYERFAKQTPTGAADPVRGIREIIAGTGGRSHYNFGTIKPNSEVRNNTAFGVLQVTLHATSYDWQFVPEAGQTFTDSGTTACH
jgi:acid phosphatase type 7